MAATAPPSPHPFPGGWRATCRTWGAIGSDDGSRDAQRAGSERGARAPPRPCLQAGQHPRRAADDIGNPTELLLPEPFGDDDRRRRPRQIVDALCESTPLNSTVAQRRKPIRGNKGDRLRLSIVAPQNSRLLFHHDVGKNALMSSDELNRFVWNGVESCSWFKSYS